MEDERVDIQVDGAVAPPLKSILKTNKRKVDVESDDEEEDGMLPNGLKGFKQRDLVAEAFAGDNVVHVSRLALNKKTIQS